MKKSLRYLLLISFVFISSGCKEPINSEENKESSTIEEKPSSPSESLSNDSSTTLPDESYEESTTDIIVPPELNETDLYVGGDSTLCSFEDTTYFYPRYGYGTQLSNHLDSKVTVKNLALSGRSSK